MNWRTTSPSGWLSEVNTPNVRPECQQCLEQIRPEIGNLVKIDDDMGNHDTGKLPLHGGQFDSRFVTAEATGRRLQFENAGCGAAFQLEQGGTRHEDVS